MEQQQQQQLHSFLHGSCICSYCGEHFAHDRYTIEAPNGEQVASFCTKECRRGYNRWILGDSMWPIRENNYKKEDQRVVHYPPPPHIVKDIRKTSRSQWLPQCRAKLCEKDAKLAQKELVTRGENFDHF